MMMLNLFFLKSRSFLFSLLIAALILFGPLVLAQAKGEIKHRVYLTANTANIEADSKIYPALQKLFATHPEPFSFLIDGDLISHGLTKSHVASDSSKIRRLLATAFENGCVIIIPGDRDWADSGEQGDLLKNLQAVRIRP